MEDLPRQVLLVVVARGKRLYHIVASHRNVPGSLQDILSQLSSRGFDLLSLSVSNLDGRASVSSLFVTLPDASQGADDLEGIIRDCRNVTSCRVELSDGGMMFEEPYAVGIETGERAILIRQETFARMLRRARELLGSGGDSIVFEEGMAAGRFEVNQLAAIAGMDRLRRHELQILNGLKARGWGRARVVKSGGPSEERTYLVDGSLECTGQTSDRPFSQFVRGYISGFHEGLWGVKITCTELK